MTLNGHYALCFKMHASFAAHHWQYKVYTDAREFTGEGCQTTVG